MVKLMEFAIFFLILTAALIFPAVLRELHVPWVVTLIIAGLCLGPSALNIVNQSPELAFLGEIGLIFLMFIAGLETNLSRLKSTEKESLTIAFFNGMVPFISGFILSMYFGFDLVTSAIVGIILMSSSAVVSVPSLEKFGLIEKKVGTTVLGSTVIQDLISLLMVGVIMQYVNPDTALPLHYFIIALVLSVIAFSYAVDYLKSVFKYEEGLNQRFEKELRTVIAILIGAVAFYELIGLEPIVAGFITGLFLSDTLKNEQVISKIHTLGYGLLIPVFFIQVGAEINLQEVASTQTLVMTTAIVFTSVIAKYSSGFIVSRKLGFDKYDSSVIASTSVPQLSTTLAVIYLGAQNQILPEILKGPLIGLVTVTTLIGPSIINYTLFKKNE